MIGQEKVLNFARLSSCQISNCGNYHKPFYCLFCFTTKDLLLSFLPFAETTINPIKKRIKNHAFIRDIILTSTSRLTQTGFLQKVDFFLKTKALMNEFRDASKRILKA